MRSAHISYQSSTLHYAYAGQGNKIVFCFHGYGEQGRNFSFLEQHAGPDFTFYAIDLPFHGQTEWREGLNFTTGELTTIIKLILEQSRPEAINDPFIVMGFSLGGRMALSLYESMPAQVEKLILLAPDGLTQNFWYWFATQTSLGNRLFLFTMKHPGWFLGFLNLFNKLKLVNAGTVKFADHYIGNKEVRLLLYKRWTTLRNFSPNKNHVKSFIIKYGTPVRLIYGKYDRVIRSSVGESFRKGIQSYCSLTVIQSGHQLLQKKHAAEIVSLLLN